MRPARPPRSPRGKPEHTAMKVAAVALMLLGLASSLPTACASTAFISKASETRQELGAVTLLEALKDQNVDRLELVDDYAVGSEFMPYQGKPFLLSRDITITSAPGSWHTLDLNFAYSVAEICASCRVSLLANLTLANARRGTAPFVDFFVGKPGSVLVLDGVVRHRIACTEAQAAARTLQSLKRSALLPGRNQSQQLLIENVTYEGKVYPNSIVYKDITWDAPLQYDEGRGYGGGYAEQTKDSVRLCDYHVSEQCLAKDTAEVCIKKLIDEVDMQQQAGGVLSGPLLAVAITLSVVFALLLSCVLGMVLYHRKQRQVYLAAKQDYEAGSGTPGERMTCKSVVGGSTGGAALPPKGPATDWELQSSFGSPFLGAVEGPDAPIELGELIGAGSFGRVYRGRWAGRDVAVKVVEHNQDTAEAVSMEMQLLMAFNSPYVIRAYRCLSYKRLLLQAPAARLESGPTVARDSVDTSCDSFVATPIGAASACNAAATAPADTGCKRDSSSSFERSRSYGGSSSDSNPTVCVVSPKVNRKSGEPAGGMNPVQEASPDAAANGQAQATPSSTVGGLICARSSGSLQATGGSNAHTSPSSVVGQGSRGSKHAPEGAPLLATWLVQEFCDLGTLKSFLARSEVPARVGAGDEQAVLLLVLLLRDTARGLAALHSQAVVHGDLNSRNVLVASDSASEAGATAKIADLGISKAIAQHKTHRTTTNLGTITHSAPELLRSGRMSPHVDVYSFGIMMWELFMGQEAFGKLLYGQFFETIVVNDLRPVVPASMPQDYTTLMEHAWATSPTERPTAQQLVQCLSHIADSRIAALQAGSGSTSTCSVAAAAATSSPVAHKTAEELLSNPSKRQLQREHQQQQLLRAATRKASNEFKTRRMSLNIQDGEHPFDVGGSDDHDNDGLASVRPAALRSSISALSLHHMSSLLPGHCSSRNDSFGAGSKPCVKELPAVSPKHGGLSPLAGAVGHAQWFV